MSERSHAHSQLRSKVCILLSRGVIYNSNSNQQGSKDPTTRVFGPIYSSINGIWALRPFYLGPWTRRERDKRILRRLLGSEVTSTVHLQSLEFKGFWMTQFSSPTVDEPQSKVLASPLITSIILPHIISI